MTTSTLRYLDIGTLSSRAHLPISGYQEYPLLPIDLTIVPVQHLLSSDICKTITGANFNFQNHQDDLTIDESAAIQLYTMGSDFYRRLNETLRSENRQALVPWFPYLKLLLTALWKLPSINGKVWRGIKQDISSQYVQGKRITWWNLSSTTEVLTVLESPQFLGRSGVRTLFSIHCRNGKRIQKHSYYPNEHEILLLPGFYGEVLGKMTMSDGLTIVDIQEVDPPYQMLKPPFETKQRPLSTRLLTVPSTTSYTASASSSSARPSTEPELNVRRHISSKIRGCGHLLDLSSERLTYDEIKFMCESLTSKTKGPEYLDLSKNYLKESEARLIAQMLRSNKTLKRLNLSNNLLRDEGASQIASVLQRDNHTLLKLDISQNQIRRSGGQALCDMIQQNNILQDINLSNTDVDGRNLEFAVQSNRTLKHLSFSHTGVSYDSSERIQQMLRQNRGVFW